jgi:hypothetical protein
MGRWSYSDRDTVEESLRLTGKNLKYAIDHSDSFVTVTWTSKRNGRKNSISIKYDSTREILELSYTSKGQEFKYYVPIIKQACNYGNYRYYFECPNTNCRSKVYTLYSSPSSHYYLCRKCQNLTYDDQKTHNKRFDAFAWMKYDSKIEELMMTGKVKDRNKAYKFIKKKDKSIDRNIDKINSFFDSMPKSINTTVTYVNGVKVRETREIL